MPVARVEGITTIGVVPGGGVISGSMPVMNLDGWTWEEGTLRPSAGLVMTYPGGGGGGRGGGGGGRGGAPADGPTPAEQIARLNALLERAASYAKSAGRPRHRSVARAVRADPQPLAGVHRQRRHASRRFATPSRGPSKQHVRIVIRGGADVAARRGVPQGARRAGDPDERADAAAARRRVPRLSVPGGGRAGEGGRARSRSRSGGYQFSRNVPFQAGRSVAWGLDHDAAIRAHDARRREHPRRRQPDRQHRAGQAGQPRR